MTNLLPPEDKRAIKNDYLLRLLALSLVLVAVIVVIGAVLVLPSYFLAQSRVVSVTEQVEVVKESVAQRSRSEAEALIRNVNEKLSVFTMGPAWMLQNVIQDISEDKPNAVSLESFLFSRNSDGSYKLTIQGVADERDDLVFFRNSLERDSRISDVELPISNLAASSDIKFSMIMHVGAI